MAGAGPPGARRWDRVPVVATAITPGVCCIMLDNLAGDHILCQLALVKGKGALQVLPDLARTCPGS